MNPNDLRLSFKPQNGRALRLLNTFEMSKVNRLSGFLDNLTGQEFDEIGEEGITRIIERVFHGGRVLGPETDEEFMARLECQRAQGAYGWLPDNDRLLKIAKRAIKEASDNGKLYHSECRIPR